jgi:cell division transport system permease protein
MNWLFFLREAFRNMRLNALMSATAATTTAVCVLILGVGLLVSAHVEGVIRQVGQSVSITAYYPDDMRQGKMEEIEKSVQDYPEVREVDFVSREQALSRFKRMMSDQPEIYEGLGSDVMPASLEIQLNDPRDSTAVADRLRGEGFRELSYPQQTVERLNQVTSYVVWALRGATVLFLVASVLLISNAIRLSIFARRKEIEVMKLVGASDGFVRWPFVLEGLVQGLVGAALAALLVVATNSLFVSWVREAVPFVPVSAHAVHTLTVLAVLIGVGALIGILGSVVSVRRFLRV